MLRLILGRAGTGKTHYIKQRIKEKMKQPIPYKKDILIVPEQSTLQSERDMLSFLGNCAGAYCEILSMRRLAHRVFLAEGGAAGTYADSGAQKLIMYMALRETKKKLTVFSKVSDKPDFIDELINIMTELKSYNITPEMMRAASIDLSGITREKVLDLIMITDAYSGIMSRSFKDPRDDLTRLCEKLSNSDYIAGRTMFIDGFSGFTPQELSVIEKMLTRADEVVITLTLPDDVYDNPYGPFSMPLKTKKALESIAKKNQVKIETNVLYENHRLNEALLFLEQNIYAIKPQIREEDTPQITIHMADNTFSEIEFAAAEIRRMIRQDGMSYRDFVVLARDLSDYSGLIDAIFSRHGIPIFMDKKDDILTKPVLLFILSAIDMAAYCFTYDSVFSYLKSGLTDIEKNDVDLLENYAIKWSIRGSKWYDNDFEYHPDGFGIAFDDESKALLEKINSIRRRMTTPVVKFREEISGVSTANEKCLALYNFLISVNLPDKIKEKSDRLLADGEMDLAMQYGRIWDLFVNVLDQMTLICADEKMSLIEFYSLLKLILSGYDLAIIPTSLDEVLVGSMDRVRPHETCCTIILGANDGVFPLISAKEGLFSDEEKQIMTDLGIRLSQGSQTRAFEEHFLIYSALTFSKDRLILCCPRADSQGGALYPSYIIAKIKEIVKKASISDDENLTALARGELKNKGMDIAAAALQDVIKGKADEQTAAICAYLSGSDQYGSDFERIKSAAFYVNSPKITNSAIVRKIYGDTMSNSASRIELYNSCHFSHFIQYTLGAKPRERMQFSEREIGTFIHSVLEQFLKEIKLSGMSFNDLDREKSRKMIRRIVHGYIETNFGGMKEKTQRFKYLFNRLVRAINTITDNLFDEFSNCDFEPMEFELDIGGNEAGAIKALEIAGNNGIKVRITGKVDRLDTYDSDGRTYVRVIDYKSGNREFDFTDVYNGLGVQMLIYLFTVCQNAEKLFNSKPYPAGVLYLHVHQPVVSLNKSATDEQIADEIRKSLKMNGLVLADDRIINAMEKELSGKGRFIPVYVKKDGVSGNIATLQQFEKLRKHTLEIVRKMADDLAGGDISINPYRRNNTRIPCTWCKYHEACMFDRTGGYNNYRDIDSISKDRFFELIEGGGSNA